jgi:hypothetical protein
MLECDLIFINLNIDIIMSNYYNMNYLRCIPLTRLYNTPYYDVESMGGFLFFSFRVFRLFLRIPFWPPSWALRPYDVRVTKMTHTLLLIESSAIFSPVIWFSSVIDCKRTTNVCESFHNQFGSMFYNSHPKKIETRPSIRRHNKVCYIIWLKVCSALRHI